MLDLWWGERGGRHLDVHNFWGGRLDLVGLHGFGCLLCLGSSGGRLLGKLFPFGDVRIVWALDLLASSHHVEGANILGGVVGGAHYGFGMLWPSMRAAFLHMRSVVPLSEDYMALRYTLGRCSTYVWVAQVLVVPWVVVV